MWIFFDVSRLGVFWSGKRTLLPIVGAERKVRFEAMPGLRSFTVDKMFVVVEAEFASSTEDFHSVMV